jgi:hypothetical protein
MPACEEDDSGDRSDGQDSSHCENLENEDRRCSKQNEEDYRAN